jgi:hypothetical protein
MGQCRPFFSKGPLDAPKPIASDSNGTLKIGAILSLGEGDATTQLHQSLL